MNASKSLHPLQIDATGQERWIQAWVSSFDAGRTQIGQAPHAIVRMHLGASSEVRCMRNGMVRQGREIVGDLEIVPAHTASVWEINQGLTALIICVPDALLRAVAAELGRNPAAIDIADRFRMRDPVIEHIAWTLKADINAGRGGGHLLREGLGTALAARLLQRHYRGSLPMHEIRKGLSPARLERVIAHIEDNLDSKLSLLQVAQVAGMSVSHLKTLFRNATGSPVHEYVLRRRVERAQLLLRKPELSIAEVALATGFAHQSHLARRMRKVLGCTPSSIRNRRIASPARATMSPAAIPLAPLADLEELTDAHSES